MICKECVEACVAEVGLCAEHDRQGDAATKYAHQTAAHPMVLEGAVHRCAAGHEVEAAPELVMRASGAAPLIVTLTPDPAANIEAPTRDPALVYHTTADGRGAMVNCAGLPIQCVAALLDSLVKIFGRNAMARNAEASDRLPPGAWYVIERKR